MVMGRSAPCSSSGIGAFLASDGVDSEALDRLVAGRWLRLVLRIGCSGVGEFWAEGSRELEESMILSGRCCRWVRGML